MYTDENFLFDNETGKKLYEKYAKDQPIFDYHCHLSPKEISEDKKYRSITEIWLGGDHYKWRAMRINGIEEKYITGDASDYDKFMAFSRTLDQAIGNPLYQWSHLELSRYFGIDEILTEKTAPDIYERANDRLKDISARSLIRDSKVTHLGTTDDPTDDLKYHQLIKDDPTFDTTVFPAFRADPAFKIEKDSFLPWLKKLEEVSDISIESITDFEESLKKRVDYFTEKGGKLADHGFEAFRFIKADKKEADRILKDRIQGKDISKEDAIKFSSYVNEYLASYYNEKNWIMQMHIGALRNTNSRMFQLTGADTGFDSMGDWSMAEDLVGFLDRLYKNQALPYTILYNLNAKDNDVFSSMMGNYGMEKEPLRVCHGTAWWFYDQKYGIENQILSFSNLGLLGRYLGMVTDSRSFLSYTRHELFRRVISNLLGSWVEKHIIPDDEEVLGNLIKKMTYQNAYDYFGYK